MGRDSSGHSATESGGKQSVEDSSVEEHLEEVDSCFPATVATVAPRSGTPWAAPTLPVGSRADRTRHLEKEI